MATGELISGAAEELFGRRAAIRMVRDFMERPIVDGVPTSRWQPVLLFVGPGGAGRSALLHDLDIKLDNNVPHARVDFAHLPTAGIEDVLELLVFELNRHCGSYGTLAFPRFIVGRIVMGLEGIDHRNPAVPYRVIPEQLETYRDVDKLMNFLNEMAAGVMAVLGLPGEIGGQVARLVFSGLIGRRRIRRVIFGPGRDWYEQLDPGRDPIKGLVELHRRAGNRAGDADRHWVDSVLLAAFMADLRDGFTASGRRDPVRSLNAVILLDNAGLPAGTHFLKRLVQARNLISKRGDGRPDPLTVVAASDGELPRHVMVDVQPLPESGIGDPDAFFRRFEDRPGNGRWWYPVRLRDLVEDDVEAMVAALRLSVFNGDHVALLVHGLTRGHPGSTRLLLDAVGDHDVEVRDDPDNLADPADLLDLRLILDRPMPGTAPSRSVRDMLIESLLGDLAGQPDVVEDLVTCSAARDRQEIRRLGEVDDLLTHHPHRLLEHDLWVPGEHGPGLVMRPALRRLLLDRLAARDDTAADGWPALHRYLRDCAEREGGPADPGVLYHALALGDEEGRKTVCKELQTSLGRMSAGDWLELLWAVTGAPNRQRYTGSPNDAVIRLSRWAGPDERACARLVTGLWLAADPLTGCRRRTLHSSVSWNYAEAMALVGDGTDDLQKEVDRHTGLAARWC
ncbi:hypothetical protein [Thermomonospora umbrina]|uniref:Uncharacterized protein n=1 Tax=Thermomonospora umbrina TaxID=111806 RepID=A0A3D9SMZ3_9ACTN|nr:hypothetical protein [Thermomonospora umbrina]REE97107.1 hypothetical protein DFJ69_2563 [Thermomonospora umbrina]